MDWIISINGLINMIKLNINIVYRKTTNSSNLKLESLKDIQITPRTTTITPNIPNDVIFLSKTCMLTQV